MERVIVTVLRADEGVEHDLEVPAELEVGRLAELIAHALKWSSLPGAPQLRFQVEARPPGRLLGPGETLASAGAWDGAWLILHPAGAGQRPTQPVGGPVREWRSLGFDPRQEAPAEADSAQPEQKTGFAWKPLDD